MTAKRDLKKRIRERAAKTGESYTAARAQFRKLRIEQAIRTFEREIREFGQPRVLTIALHPHLSGVAHRINFLTEIVEGLRARSDTVFMNGSQITDWYLSQRKTA